jgi:hypothetical protein
MLYDFESSDIATNILKTCDIQSYNNDFIFKYIHENMDVLITVHRLIDADCAIIYVNILDNDYDEVIVKVIPYILLIYFSKYHSYKCFIFYSDDYDILDQYYKMVWNMPTIKYYWLDHETHVSNKYMYKLISNCNHFSKTYQQLIEYMDNHL